MRVLVTGANGQLGQELAEILPERGHDVMALSRDEMDVADPGAVRRIPLANHNKAFASSVRQLS